MATLLTLSTVSIGMFCGTQATLMISSMATPAMGNDTMPKQKNGTEYKTIVDASSDLGISKSTIRRYIANGIFPLPDRVFFGQQSVAVFSDKYIKDAAEILDRMRRSG